MRSEGQNEVRGARDLADLWRAMPVGVLRYVMPEAVPMVDPLSLSDALRARAVPRRWPDGIDLEAALLPDHAREIFQWQAVLPRRRLDHQADRFRRAGIHEVTSRSGKPRIASILYDFS